MCDPLMINAGRSRTSTEECSFLPTVRGNDSAESLTAIETAPERKDSDPRAERHKHSNSGGLTRD